MTDLPRPEVMIDLIVESGTLVMDEGDAMQDFPPTATDGTYNADDVLEALKSCGSKSRALEDWDLLDKEQIRIGITHRRWIEEDGKPKAVTTRAEW